MNEKKFSAYQIFRWLIILLAVALVVLPILFLFFTSVKPQSELYNNPKILPTQFLWDNYKSIFTFESLNSGILFYLKNTIIVALVSTLITVAFGSMCAYGLSRLRKGKLIAIITAVIVVVRFYPKITVILPYFLLMKNLHLLDTLSAIIISHISIGIPLTVMMMTTFYNEVPKEMEEASRVDGASVLTTYFRVVVPTTLSGMAATAILMVMTSWNEFLLASGLASNHAKTFPIVIAGFVTDKGTDWGGMAALSIVAMVPMVLIVLFTQKYLIRGLTAGAVKG
ncbi:carbohydrate ABC transporter permease [Youxingia wuxianensis]|uniref:Carbohydrate ABC transporter permease n=1 Tax=Youxingia wuxianensis TaxID=2763678 RepID=A0A926EMP6_9FIRM|nr:carbohydrate ABC transporter permease [Youxingia wuxianensis]MBC8585416.1 carbohydrate ABC transporter permease [Youxingia wuxianensis]